MAQEGGRAIKKSDVPHTNFSEQQEKNIQEPISVSEITI